MFNFIRLENDHCEMISKLSWRNLTSTTEEIEANIFRSSVYASVGYLNISKRSLMNKTKKKGPRLDPCGTADVGV